MRRRSAHRRTIDANEFRAALPQEDNAVDSWMQTGFRATHEKLTS